MSSLNRQNDRPIRPEVQKRETLLMWKSIVVASLIVIASALNLAVSMNARADEPTGEYYYPKPGSHEAYKSPARTLDEVGRTKRVGFVIGLTQQVLARPHEVAVAVFTAGEDDDELVIVSTKEGRLNTVYRARALFAIMTAIARTMPLFTEFGVEDTFTFFDLAKMLGFKTITASDGDEFTHQVNID